jgi:dTDP-4-amino-4,6-dideoxygalactose transaminase
MSFIDLNAQREQLEPGLSRAVAEVIGSGFYIGGPKVQEAEEKLSAFCSARHCIACANGTDALLIVLMAWEVGPGDAVFVPAFTFAAAAAVVARLGATPVFLDVSTETFNVDPRSLSAAIMWARENALRRRVIIPVDLFGQPADYAAIEAIAAAEGLLVLCDAAQSFGARTGERPVGTFGAATATSFYPSKPLGCYGDGGAVFTDDGVLAAKLRSIRDHGQGSHRYEHVRIGLNSRLDAIQAAVLLEKLKIFPREFERRQQVASRYGQALADVVVVPVVKEGVKSSWAQYTLQLENRDAVAKACAAAGIPTAIHYPISLNRQAAFSAYPTAPGGVPESERLAETVISLPIHPYLSVPAQDRIISVVRGAVAETAGRTGSAAR